MTSVHQMVYALYSRGIDILDKVFFRDEAWSHLSGYINSHTSRIWSAENLHTFHERLLHSLKVRVWCAVSRQKIIGPFFFSETAERYQELIMNLISLLEVDEQAKWGYGAYSKSNNAASSLVVALFLKTCGPLDPWIYHHQIFIFGGFEGERVQQQCAHIRRIEAKY
jgi:hypothetical protein